MPKLSKTDLLYRAFEDAWEKFYERCGPPMQFRVIITGEASVQSLADLVNFSYPVVRAALLLKKNGPENMSEMQAKKYVRVLQNIQLCLTDDILGESENVKFEHLSGRERFYVKHDGSSFLNMFVCLGFDKGRKRSLDLLRIKKYAMGVLSACVGCIDSVNPAREKFQKGMQICAIMQKENYDEYFYKKGYKERLV